MKKEATIGTATLLAIAAMVGVSMQAGQKPTETARIERGAVESHAKPGKATTESHRNLAGCGSLRNTLQDFLEIKHLILPLSCYEESDPERNAPRPDLSAKTSELRFVVALLPDPVHTHLSTIFDQLAVSIQEGAQDEKYDFDSSWFPWEDEQSPYPLLEDEKLANKEKGQKEDQPGVILFRKIKDCPKAGSREKTDCEKDWSPAASQEHGGLAAHYRHGLVVFVVAEEATHGIHKQQFRNALAWIAALHSPAGKRTHMGILGPSFSGSLPSLAQLLSEPGISAQLDSPLAIHSGSVSGNASAQQFQDSFPQVDFHSFVQGDDALLRRFCDYMQHEQPDFDPRRLAIISEDETAYGRAVENTENKINTPCPDVALALFYPRDISALRGAYQSKSLFSLGTSSTPSELSRNLPTDLADPAGSVHDSIRSYGGPQTPLSQEAFLMEMVNSLRELHTRYILLRSSNSLDQLFLANFLRRSYPDGRIVILGSDLMFIREQGATGLTGALTLSTYPLFPLERKWTEHQSLPASDRSFSSDTSEGTYVAFRLLLNASSVNEGNVDGSHCHVGGRAEKALFLPSIQCGTQSPIPDYSPPFWELADACGEMKDKNPCEMCSYPGPATWLSVIGMNRFWPLAALTEQTPNVKVNDVREGRLTTREGQAGGLPEVPLGMKIFLLVLAGFAVFHACCCWFGSYTARPVFLAHFASTGDWRHTWLIFGGSCCVAFLAIVAAWGSGVFTRPAPGLKYPAGALAGAAFVWLMACGAVLANSRTARKLAKDLSRDTSLPRRTAREFASWNYWATGLFIATSLVCGVLFVMPVESVLIPENRALTYWRSMHLGSGVSPIVPIFSILAGLYLFFWFTLHGLALFGPDSPSLPPKQRLALADDKGNSHEFLRMFSQEDAGTRIAAAATPCSWKLGVATAALSTVFLVIAAITAGGVPVRSLGAKSYALLFLVGLSICCSISIVEAWKLYWVWNELKRLLSFLDRVPLRRTMQSLQGFSWGSVWKMSGNVLEVRYKVISRQIECMNHTISSLQELIQTSTDVDVRRSYAALLRMRRSGMKFAAWYSEHYLDLRAGDLSSFRDFQSSIADASGILFAHLLVPKWRNEEKSLLVVSAKDAHEEVSAPLAPAEDAHIRNAEEFVCLNYLGFIQNVLGRLRTQAMSIIALFVAAAVAMSSYPFDPRQPLSAVLIVLFVIGGVAIVKVYAEMHRDSTLSHVTNTKPGELGSEFWFRIVGFGLAPLIGLLTRIFPGITDFVFSWIQPAMSSFK